MDKQRSGTAMSLPTILPSIDVPEVPEWPYDDEEDDE
jgi:hypothetical protein